VNKTLIICDRVMYGALLGMIFVLPYSLALIEMCQVTMMLAWASKSFLLCKTPVHQAARTPSFNFSSGMGWSLIAIGLLIVLTVPFSHYPSVSIKKFFTRFVQQIFLMYLVIEIIRSRRRLYGVLAVLFLTFCFVIIDAMVQLGWGHNIIHHTPLSFGRVTGPMNHPNDMGTLLVTALPVVLVSIITSRTWIPFLLGSKSPCEKTSSIGTGIIFLLFLLMVIALGLTSSRGAWVAFAVSMVTLGVYLKSPKLTALIIVILAVFLWGFGVHCLSTRSDMYSVSLPQGSVIHPSFSNPFGLPGGYSALGLFMGPSGREFYWNTAIDVFKHYPWFGCGYSAYMQTLSDLHVGHVEYPHNSVLHIAAELGAVGLVLYGWFFTALFLQIKNVLRTVSHERDLFLLGCGLSSGILAWFIHGLMDTAWASLQLSVLWWLFIGILLSLGFISSNKGEKLCP